MSSCGFLFPRKNTQCAGAAAAAATVGGHARPGAECGVTEDLVGTGKPMEAGESRWMSFRAAQIALEFDLPQQHNAFEQQQFLQPVLNRLEGDM